MSVNFYHSNHNCLLWSERTTTAPEAYCEDMGVLNYGKQVQVNLATPSSCLMGTTLLEFLNEICHLMNLKIRKKDIPVVRQRGMVVIQWKSIQTIVSRRGGAGGWGFGGAGGLLGVGVGVGGQNRMNYVSEWRHMSVTTSQIPGNSIVQQLVISHRSCNVWFTWWMLSTPWLM